MRAMPVEGMARVRGSRRSLRGGPTLRYRLGVSESMTDLAPELRRCVALVRASLPKRPKRLAEPLDTVLATIEAVEAGRAVEELDGLDEALADLASVGPKRSKNVEAAIEALVSFVRVAAGDGDLDREGMRACIAMSLAPPPAPPTLESVRARLESLEVGDDAGLAALVEVACEHRMRALAPMLLDRLELDDSTLVPSHAVRLLQRLFVPDVEGFVTLCAERLGAERAATRRWAARGLSTSVRPEHVPALVALLEDREPLVRREAASALRAAHAWHAESRDAIRAAAVAASGAFPGDRALAELLAASRDP